MGVPHIYEFYPFELKFVRENWHNRNESKLLGGDSRDFKTFPVK